MVTIVYLILCWCGVFDFSWWFPFIESIILLILALLASAETEGSSSGSVYLLVAMFFTGLLIFSFYKLFADITISNWFILLTPFWAIIAYIVPGGTTISNILLHNAGLMLMPRWFLIAGIVLDVIEAISIVYSIIDDRKNKN